MAGLLASVPDVFDTENLALGQMPCHTELPPSQVVDHGTGGDEACPMECCQDDDCSLDQSCQSCLNLHFDNAMLLETLKFCFPCTLRSHSETVASRLADRPILPEIHPPASLRLS